MFETQRKGGVPHVPIEVIWADIQTRVLGWGHCIIFVDALGPGVGDTAHLFEGTWSDVQTKSELKEKILTP